MRRVIIAIASLLMIITEGWGGYLSMGMYQNPKFGFSVRYPGHIFVHKEIPDAGDGIILKGRDGLECRVYGSWYAETIGETYRNTLQWEREAGNRITYKVLKRNWFVISGIDKDGVTLFYQKTYFKKETSVSMRFVYRIKDKIRYDSLVSDMIKAFHF